MLLTNVLVSVYDSFCCVLLLQELGCLFFCSGYFLGVYLVVGVGYSCLLGLLGGLC